ncbi:peptide-methionine (S)-S-oxide reductase MsrA [Halobacteriovorax sp. JY17]|uniref:peptide-methionine (S)-S-oxide reductase MsrA n=1 Tax=Halobacteriovorax sp. JY17 TaxID=2014617 RepID=UPI000C3CB644|nr:peptide-methionine (S)-S-oxide reductase MsrA [Halobacteriovorax sp. JY17]PIK16250.1 MAG: peptide-methionine (S)-S-oxide reductase [Halobacteriovorax sp. JY17]
MKNILIVILLFLGAAHLASAKEDIRKATFAGGCFWCMEGPFDKLEGVLSTTSGYIGGESTSPTYKAVSSGGTGHTEAVEVTFDANKVSYEKLLSVFWRNIDPTDNQGQFVDRGSQYRPGVFYYNESQKELARKSKLQLAESKRFKKEIVVEITKAGVFYPAEEYHQDFYKKSPIRYKFYRFNSGRDQFLQKYWKK